MSSSPPSLSRQGSGTIAYENMSPQMQRQKSISSASHGIIPDKHLSTATMSTQAPPHCVEERSTFSMPTRAATDRYLNILLTRTRK